MPYQAKINRAGEVHICTVAIQNGQDAIEAVIYYDGKDITRGYLITFSRQISMPEYGKSGRSYEHFHGRFNGVDVEGQKKLQAMFTDSHAYTKEMIVFAIKAPRVFKDVFFQQHIVNASNTDDFYGNL
jgi:hypothetical protein